MHRFSVAALLLLLIVENTFGQNQEFLTWSRVQWQVQLPKKLNLLVETEDRRYLAYWVHNQTMARVGLRHEIIKGLDVYGGFSAFANGSNKPTIPAAAYKIELRPELGIGYKHQKGIATFYHRFRGEFRLSQKSSSSEFSDGFVFFGRLRYQFNSSLQLTAKRGKGPAILWKVSLEPLVIVGKEVNKIAFDQFRVFTGFEMELIKKTLSVEAGYLFLYQKKLGKQEYLSRHILRCSLIYRLDFSRKN